MLRPSAINDQKVHNVSYMEKIDDHDVLGALREIRRRTGKGPMANVNAKVNNDVGFAPSFDTSGNISVIQEWKDSALSSNKEGKASALSSNKGGVVRRSSITSTCSTDLSSTERSTSDNGFDTPPRSPNNHISAALTTEKTANTKSSIEFLLESLQCNYYSQVGGIEGPIADCIGGGYFTAQKRPISPISPISIAQMKKSPSIVDETKNGVHVLTGFSTSNTSTIINAAQMKKSPSIVDKMVNGVHVLTGFSTSNTSINGIRATEPTSDPNLIINAHLALLSRKNRQRSAIKPWMGPDEKEMARPVEGNKLLATVIGEGDRYIPNLMTVNPMELMPMLTLMEHFQSFLVTGESSDLMLLRRISNLLQRMENRLRGEDHPGLDTPHRAPANAKKIAQQIQTLTELILTTTEEFLAGKIFDTIDGRSDRSRSEWTLEDALTLNDSFSGSEIVTQKGGLSSLFDIILGEDNNCFNNDHFGIVGAIDEDRTQSIYNDGTVSVLTDNDYKQPSNARGAVLERMQNTQHRLEFKVFTTDATSTSIPALSSNAKSPPADSQSRSKDKSASVLYYTGKTRTGTPETMHAKESIPPLLSLKNTTPASFRAKVPSLIQQPADDNCSLLTDAEGCNVEPCRESVGLFEILDFQEDFNVGSIARNSDDEADEGASSKDPRDGSGTPTSKVDTGSSKRGFRKWWCGKKR
jgi:hypothetical protein